VASANATATSLFTAGDVKRYQGTCRRIEMQKLSIAFNEISRLLSKNRRLRRTELTRALDKTLKDLDELLEDKAILDKAAKIKNQSNKSDILPHISDLRQFQDAFLSIENRALTQAGIDPVGRKVIIRKMRTLRKDIDSLVSSNKTPTEMTEGTRGIVLELLDSLENEDPDFQIKPSVEKDLRRVLTLAGGTMIVGVNAGISLASPISSAISVSFGSALIGKYI